MNQTMKASDKVYEVRRDGEGGPVIATVNGAPLPHIVWHSPTGFEMGYGGSGPADLALSILADHLGEQPTEQTMRHTTPLCWKYHQAFKFAFVALNRDFLRITTAEIAAWLKRERAEREDV
jgi:hypothetical protein